MNPKVDVRGTASNTVGYGAEKTKRSSILFLSHEVLGSTVDCCTVLLEFVL